MSLCEYCNKESKFLFICSHCGKRFCREHRYPENHECSNVNNLVDAIEEIELQSDSDIDDQNVQPIEEDPSPQEILLSANEAELDQNSQEELNGDTQYKEIEYEITETNNMSSEPNSKKPSQNKENEIVSKFTKLTEHKTPLTIIIIVTLITGALAGILIYPQNTGNLQRRYDSLYEYYIELQSQNLAISQDLENMTLLINILENELESTRQELSSIHKDWNSIFSDQTQFVKPTVNQLRTWLAGDLTDQQIINIENTPLHQALQLSLKAKSQGWKLGVIIVYGNYTDRLNNNTYNIIKIDDDVFENVFVYLDPQTDLVWWNPNYETITSGQIWDLGEYSSVYVTDINLILEP